MKKIARWFGQTLEFVAESAHQVGYVGFTLAALFAIYNVMPKFDSFAYTIFIVIHYITIAVFGYKISEADFKQAKVYRAEFIAVNLLFMLPILSVTDSLYIILLVLYMFVIGSIYLYVTLHYIHGAYGKKDDELYGFSHEHKNLFYFIVLFLPVIAMIVTLAFLPWNLYVKIGIVLVYIISMPFIGIATENGFDLEEVFLISW